MKYLCLVPLFALALASTYEPNSDNGQVLVHMFEWKWSDVARECEDFLGPKHFAGVQISPPHECSVIDNADGQYRPWFERYQAVSYKLESRSGNREEFIDMVDRCNAVGVRIYADVVFNHMTASNLGTNYGTAGTVYDADAKSYPGVPYSYEHFHTHANGCPCEDGGLYTYDDPYEIRNCNLVGMNDLDQSNSYVRQTLINYMDDLLSIGVDGFRFDAAKHMWPADLEAIIGATQDTIFGTRPFIIMEVIDVSLEPVSSGEYFGLGRVTEFNYANHISEVFHGDTDLKYLSNFYEGSDGWGMMDREYALVFVDNHDNQRGEGSGSNIVTFRDPRNYKMAVGFALAWLYGYTRIISSYYWDTFYVNGKDQNYWYGPPHDDDMNILDVEIQEDGTCAGDWNCEHRWRQITNMVGFRNVVHGTDFNDFWDNGKNQISFCRGGKGFVAINQDSYHLQTYLQTCLSAGTYCDVISGEKVDGECTGKTVTVESDGTGYIEILTSDYDGILAIHEESKL